MDNKESYNPIIICNILNHGHTYDEWSTSFIIGMSKIPWINQIKAIVPLPNNAKKINMPEKVRIVESIEYDWPMSMIKLALKIKDAEGNPVIIVYGPTAFGEGNLSNLIGMILPILITLFSRKNVKIINQGSTLTHNPKELGYNSLTDKLRGKVVKIIEMLVYKRVKTYFQLDYYKNLAIKQMGKEYFFGVIRSDFIDPITTLYLNNMDETQQVNRRNKFSGIGILMHGYWGPQKDPEVAFNAIRNLKRKNKDIKLTLSGGINHHFLGYKEYFEKIIKEFDDIIDENLGYVEEKDLAGLFLENEIVLMPYRASGGQSGILEMASFFENIVVCTDFPEFREEKKSNLVIITTLAELEQSIERAIAMVRYLPQTINVKDKVETVTKNITNFLLD